MSTDAHAEALKTLLTEAVKAPAYDIDDLQKLTTKPANYVEVYLARRYGGNVRLDGMQGNDLRRLSTRVVASSVTNGRLIEDRIFDAFAFTTVDLGDAVTQVAFESGDAGVFEYDAGAYVGGLIDWTFVLP
ncbi:MAG: hypothetical protein ACXWDF_10725 [Aeromicrobium sp.]